MRQKAMWILAALVMAAMSLAGQQQGQMPCGRPCPGNAGVCRCAGTQAGRMGGMRAQRGLGRGCCGQCIRQGQATAKPAQPGSSSQK